uniref:Uncharacterized protein n=1 Tax=uncultured Desulfobacterium sp. TaxID=201089 RepID=E1YHE2_9BACT|nr:unknown protein [uncultured Desulfobacterium sp.]
MKSDNSFSKNVLHQRYINRRKTLQYTCSGNKRIRNEIIYIYHA